MNKNETEIVISREKRPMTNDEMIFVQGNSSPANTQRWVIIGFIIFPVLLLLPIYTWGLASQLPTWQLIGMIVFVIAVTIGVIVAFWRLFGRFHTSFLKEVSQGQIEVITCRAPEGGFKIYQIEKACGLGGMRTSPGISSAKLDLLFKSQTTEPGETLRLYLLPESRELLRVEKC